MNSVSPAKRPCVVLCPPCRRQLLQRLAIHPPINPADMLRAPEKGMASAPDPRAEKVRRHNDRKEQKRALRATLQRDGIGAAAKLFITTRALQRQSASEDCPRCLALKQRVA